MLGIRDQSSTVADMKYCPVLVFLLTLSFSAYSLDQEHYGPFDLEMEEVGECEVKGNGDISLENLAVKALSKNTLEVSFVATTKIEVDDDIFVTAQVEAYDEEKKMYGPKFLKLPIGSLCSALTTYMPKSYSKFFQAIGVDDCPVKPGTYTLKKFPMELTIPLARLPYKKLRTDVFFQKKGATVLCTRVFFNIVPEGTAKYPQAK